jgi:hypothetical protein
MSNAAEVFGIPEVARDANGFNRGGFGLVEAAGSVGGLTDVD